MILRLIIIRNSTLMLGFQGVFMRAALLGFVSVLALGWAFGAQSAAAGVEGPVVDPLP